MSPSARRFLLIAGLAVAAVPQAGCQSKKLASGNAMDQLVYGLFSMDRDTNYYYDVLANAHQHTDFCYKCTEDPYLADKCVDAIIHLGRASYGRLEGEVQVILLLSDVLIEDPAALARDRAAASLALLATRLPVSDDQGIPERGDRFLLQLKELKDVLHDEEGRRRVDTPATKRRVADLVGQIGRYDLPNLQLTKDALRWFPAMKFITQETDPALRDVFDRAMVRRSRAVVFASLESAVLDRVPHVRQSAVQGLKTLAYAKAVESVAERLDVETSPLVRGEMAEYFGAVGGATATGKLVGMLSDDDGGVRHKARLGLVRLSGVDYGSDLAAWKAWLARQGADRAPPPATCPLPDAPAPLPQPPPPAPEPPVAPVPSTPTAPQPFAPTPTPPTFVPAPAYVPPPAPAYVPPPAPSSSAVPGALPPPTRRPR